MYAASAPTAAASYTPLENRKKRKEHFPPKYLIQLIPCHTAAPPSANADFPVWPLFIQFLYFSCDNQNKLEITHTTNETWFANSRICVYSYSTPTCHPRRVHSHPQPLNVNYIVLSSIRIWRMCFFHTSESIPFIQLILTAACGRNFTLKLLQLLLLLFTFAGLIDQISRQLDKWHIVDCVNAILVDDCCQFIQLIVLCCTCKNGTKKNEANWISCEFIFASWIDLILSWKWFPSGWRS